jgi:hypothetical protein
MPRAGARIAQSLTAVEAIMSEAEQVREDGTDDLRRPDRGDRLAGRPGAGRDRAAERG